MSIKLYTDNHQGPVKSGLYVRLDDIKDFDLQETILPVLNSFGQMSQGISNEHLAKQIADQVKAWIKLSVEDGRL